MKIFTLLMDMAINPEQLASSCSQVVLEEDPQRMVWEAPADVGDHSTGGLVCFKNVPTYLVHNDAGNYAKEKRSSPTVNGYTIDLHGILDIGQYMTQHFSKKNRGNIIRSVRRLEDAYNIKYTRYYGEIDKQECDHLVGLLKEMIISRFEERNETSHTLRDWEDIQNTLYPLILQKKASLVVLSQGEIPIAISISYHYNELFFYFSTSFDITYNKFSMGSIMLYKQLEWSIANNYLFFEMGWGDLDYKRRWSNRVQPLRNHYVFSGSEPMAVVRYTLVSLKSRLIAYLISIKVNVLYRKVRNWMTRKKSSFVPVVYELEEVSAPPDLEASQVVNTELPGNTHLKTILNDFLYSSQENYSQTRIYSYKDDFYIKGKTCCKKIQISSGAGGDNVLKT